VLVKRNIRCHNCSWIELFDFVEFCSDLDVVCYGSRFDSSWIRVFIDVPIAYDVETLLQDPALVLCCVCSWHDDVVVVIVAMDAGRDRVVGLLEDSLDDVDALLIQKILHVLDDVHT
jgi:hypothetical protein